MLTPVEIIKKSDKEKRASAKEKFFEKVDELRDMKEEEIEAAISEAIDSVRKEKCS